MRRLAKILSMGETRTGISQKTGEPWAMTDVVIEWSEQEPNCQPYDQSAVISVPNLLDVDEVQKVINARMEVAVTFYMEKREWNGKYFNNIRGFLPKDLIMK